jgi:hypothetical protein
MYAIKGKHPSIIYGEALHEFVENIENFQAVAIIIQTYVINLNDAHTERSEKALQNNSSSDPLQPFLQDEIKEFNRILNRLDSFKKSILDEASRNAVRTHLIGSLKDILNDANSFILSCSTDPKTNLFQQDPIYRQPESLFKD